MRMKQLSHVGMMSTVGDLYHADNIFFFSKWMIKAQKAIKFLYLFQLYPVNHVPHEELLNSNAAQKNLSTEQELLA